MKKYLTTLVNAENNSTAKIPHSGDLTLSSALSKEQLGINLYIASTLGMSQWYQQNRIERSVRR